MNLPSVRTVAKAILASALTIPLLWVAMIDLNQRALMDLSVLEVLGNALLVLVTKVGALTLIWFLWVWLFPSIAKQPAAT